MLSWLRLWAVAVAEAEEARPRVIDQVAELIQALDLKEIRFYEINGSASDETEPDEGAQVASVSFRTAHRRAPSLSLIHI